MNSVGFVGLGNIGRPMAEHLLKCGVDLCVCDKREDVLSAFSSLGARTTPTPSGCARADMVIVMVNDSDQVRDVLLGEEGLCAAIDAASPPLVAVMSTVPPETVFELREILAKQNVRLVDAPVAGGAQFAARGELSILVGGTEEDFRSAEPVFRILGKSVFHCGALGAGESMKILNNLVGIANLLLMTEIGEVAVQMGIDLDSLSRVMDESTGRNFATKDYNARRELYRYNSNEINGLRNFLDTCRKDFRIGLDIASSKGVNAKIISSIYAASSEESFDEGVFASWRYLKDY